MALSDKSQEKEIDGVVYEVTPVPFGVGLKSMVRLSKIMAKGVARTVKAGDKSGQLSALMDFIAEDMNEEDVVYFAKIFGDSSRYSSGKNMVPLIAANQEIHFSGNYGAFFKWMRFCIEVNYSSFFGGSGGPGVLSELLQEVGAK